MNIAVVIVGILIVVFPVSAVVDAIRVRPRTAGLRAIFIGCLALQTIGAEAFLADFAGQMGLIPFVDATTEFPVGRPDALLKDSAGNQFAAIEAANRVQMYDADGRFVRGWFVDAGGGTFALRLTRAGLIEMRAPRTDRVVYYSAEGAEQQPQSARDAETVYSATSQPNVRFPYPWWEWPLTHPFAAFTVTCIGMLGAAQIRRRGMRVAPASANV